MAEIVDTIAGFGFCTDAASPDLSDLDVQLARIEASGASHCELSLYELDLIAGGRVLPERRWRLEQICARRSLRYTAHGVLTVNFMDEQHLALHKAVCRATLELCAAVGASVMAHHPGRVAAAGAAQLERLHALERDALREMGDVAAGYGVKIAVENLFVENARTYTADPVRLASEIAAIDHPNVCGLLDFSHAYIMTAFRGMDYVPTLEAFAPEVNHLHVHDSFGRPTSTHGFYRFAEQIAFGMGDLHLPIGLGRHPLGRNPAPAAVPLRHGDHRRAVRAPLRGARSVRGERAALHGYAQPRAGRGGLNPLSSPTRSPARGADSSRTCHVNRGSGTR